MKNRYSNNRFIYSKTFILIKNVIELYIPVFLKHVNHRQLTRKHNNLEYYE